MRNRNQVVIPMDLEIRIDEKDPVRKLVEICDEMDYTDLYNVQIGLESEYIIGLGLFPNPTDTTTLPPFLNRVQEKSGHKIENIIADAGYASEENYNYLE